jgi:sec-independent protein translocase protein TatC
MWILFEIGLILSKIMEKRKAERRAAEGLVDDDPDDDDPRRGGPSAGPRRGGPGSGGQTPRPGAPGTTARPRTSGSATASGAGAATASAAAGAGDTKEASAETGEFRPLSPEEMDAELDRLEEEERLLAEKRAQKEGKTEPPTDTAATSPTESAEHSKKD